MAHNNDSAPTPGFSVDRAQGIGASEIAAVVGLGSYSHAVEVWEAKTGRAKPREDTHHTLRGKFLEPGLLAWLGHETGLDVRATRDENTGLQTTFVGNPKIVYATPDAIVYDGLREVANVDVKSPSRTWKRWFNDAGQLVVPDEYVAQLAWQAYAMATSDHGIDVEQYVSGAMLDHQLYYKVLGRDRELEDYLVEEAERWWRDYVVADRPPPVDGSEASERFLARFFPAEKGKEVPAEELDTELAERVRVLIKLADEWRTREKGAAETLAVYKNELRMALGERAGVKFDDRKVTWKSNKTSERVNWKAACEELLRERKATEAAAFLLKHTEKVPGARVLRFSIKAGSSE